MKLETFFEKFDHLADLPDAISKVRELILSLAIQGKLVLHDSAHESTSTAHLLEPTQPFSIPASWNWSTLTEIGICQTGKTPPTKDSNNYGSGFPFIGPGQITPRGRFLLPQKTITSEGLKHTSIASPGDILMVCIGGSIGKAAICQETIGFNQQINSIRTQDQVPNYVFTVLSSNYFQYEVINRAKGSATPIINKRKWEQIPIPLPPIAEQKRIVAKVDELMALCDQLEAQQQERDQQASQLARAALARFADAPTPANLNLLFNPLPNSPFFTPNSHFISPANLRKSILTLAVQGKLVSQDPKDGQTEIIPVSPSQVEGKKKKAPKWSGPLEEEEIPFQLPSSWEWTRLGNISNLKHGYAFSSQFFTSEPADYVLTTPGNFFERGGFRDREGKRKYFNGPVNDEFVFTPGDLIIPMTEQAAGLLGSPAFIPNDGRTYLHNQRLGKMSFHPKTILPQFAFWFFNSDFFRNELARTCTGMKVRHTSPDRVLRVPFPASPLAEQRRIVAKVDQLMALVNELETQLADSRTTAKNLLEALVAELTAANSKSSAAAS